MSRRYFITGTDTDCGKTYVTCRLLEYLTAKGHSALAIKPVASGCYEQDGILISDDAVALQRHNGGFQDDITAWRFLPPISPHLAAAAVSQHLSVSAMVDFCNQSVFTAHDYLLIEGAGGLMVPLNAEETWVDFIRVSQIPVLLVVGMRLGCLNHALLSDAVLQQQALPYVGWIANCLDNNMMALSENIMTLQEKMSKPCLGTVSYGKHYLPTIEIPI